VSEQARHATWKKLTVLATGSIAAAFFGCAAATTPGVPQSPGEKIYLSKCGACHIRPGGDEFHREGWKKVLDKHRNRVPLKPEQRRTLLDFLSGYEKN